MKVIKGLIIVVAILLAGAGGAYVWAGNVVGEYQKKSYLVPPVNLEAFKDSVDLSLGERIATVRNGCVDCHGQDLGGNTVINDPAMGRIDAPNITPAKLSTWTDAEIARAIRHGIGKRHQALFLMPATEFISLSGGDLASLVAYLRTVPSVDRENGPIELGPLAKMLIAAGKLPTAYTADIIDHSQPFTNKPAEEPTAEFGKYLANACTGCHNPQFTGGPIPGGAPDWPPAADLTKLDSWSAEDFYKLMRTGVNPQGATMRPPFPIALTSHMSDLELQALWEFFAKLSKTTAQTSGGGDVVR